jgi:hypothetical protein
MKDIRLIKLEKYGDPKRFEKVAEGIYRAVCDYEDNLVEKGQYVTAFSFTLEEDLNEIENRQYPLEDILDKFLAHVSEFIQDDRENPVMILELCTQGWLDRMEELIKINGKHVFNKKITKDGKTYIELVIE